VNYCSMKDPKIDRQREHQANERTFLAWLRTSLALIGFGFAIARFILFLRQPQTSLMEQDTPTHPLFNSENLGVTLVILGVAVIAFAAWQYNRVFWQIERGNYRPNRWFVGIITVLVMIVGLLSLPLLLWRTHQERLPTNVPSRLNSKP
jgi:putative membrane protein